MSAEKTAKGRGGKRPGAGRKESGKVKMTVHISPETRAYLGAKPGESIDALFTKLRQQPTTKG